MKEAKRKLVRNFLSRRSGENSAVLWVIIILMVCYMLSFSFWYYPFGKYLNASPEKVFEAKEYWRLFTSSFIHSDLSHYLSNSFMLVIMGYFVNYHYGRLIFPVVAFLSGILINLIVIWNYSPEVSLVGASGVVFWLWGFWLILYMAIQRHISFIRRFLNVTSIGLFILVPSQFSENVSYYAHGVGIVLGGLFGLIYFIINSKKIFSQEEWVDIVEPEDDEEIGAISDERTNRS